MLVYTNDPRNEMKIVTLTVQRYEPNALYMTGNTDAQASMPEVDVMLDNYSAVTALQMDVRYPHTVFTLDPQDISLTERAEGHLVSAARLDDSTLRVLVLSMQNNPFIGNSGAVARLQLQAQDSLSTESYPIRLLNVTSGCTDGVDRLSSIQSTGWFATRIVHDTTVVEVHDTTLVPYAVHDTTIAAVMARVQVCLILLNLRKTHFLLFFLFSSLPLFQAAAYAAGLRFHHQDPLRR
jgi:hypothetical protein